MVNALRPARFGSGFSKPNSNFIMKSTHRFAVRRGRHSRRWVNVRGDHGSSSSLMVMIVSNQENKKADVVEHP
jgi:hypothetical protein